MLIDSHTHLNLITDNSNEIEQIIDKCEKEHIYALFNISVDYESNLISLDLSQKYKNIYFSAGIHPSEADNYNMSQIDEIIEIAGNEKCIGIGETGIDLFRNYSKLENQKMLFEVFLNIAKKAGKPIIIHSRDAFKDVYEIINKNEFKSVKCVFHCFSYSYEEAKKCIDQGHIISFAGNLTYKNAHNLHETAKKIPVDHIIIETDSPYLTPMPKRGEKNYPYNLVYIAEFLSNIKHISMKDLTEKLHHNITTFFKING